MPLFALLAASATPTPTDTGLNPNDYSPGLPGFLATLGLVLVSIVLFINMNRRIRRMRYRAEHEYGAEAPGEERPDGPDERSDGTPRP